MNTDYPHILVIANNLISQTNNNGRTLGSLFKGWPKDALAEIGVVSQHPDFSICNKYYVITDNEIKTAFIYLKKASGKELIEEQAKPFVGGRGKRRRTAFSMIARHIVWNNDRWYSKQLKQWITDFNPDAVLLQNSDTTGVLRMGNKIANDFTVPLFMFNTEGFYFFKKDYISDSQFSHVLYPIYRHILRRQIRQTMKSVRYIFHGNTKLKEDYDKEFGIPSTVTYTGSVINGCDEFVLHNPPIFAYIGNFEYERYRPLLEVADVLKMISPNSVLDLYGGISFDQRKQLEKKDNIRVHGFVDYSSVLKIINKSDVLFHVEVQDKFQEALKYGFSTKIADSISSGKCFVMYSSPDIAGAKYVIETGAGWVASTKDELKDCLNEVLNDSKKRKEKLQKAKDISLKNHNVHRVSTEFQNNIISLIQNINENYHNR